MSRKGQPGLIASWPTLVWPWNMIWNIYVAGMRFENSSSALIVSSLLFSPTLRCKNSFAETLNEPQIPGLVPVFLLIYLKAREKWSFSHSLTISLPLLGVILRKKKHFYNRWLYQSAGLNVSTEAGNGQLCHFIICQLLSVCFNIIYFLMAAFLQPSFPLKSRIKRLLWNITINQAKM